MENSVVFDEQVMEIVKTFLAEEVDDLPDAERTPKFLCWCLRVCVCVRARDVDMCS